MNLTFLDGVYIFEFTYLSLQIRAHMFTVQNALITGEKKRWFKSYKSLTKIEGFKQD